MFLDDACRRAIDKRFVFQFVLDCSQFGFDFRDLLVEPIALGIPICAVLIVAAERFTAAIRRSPKVMRAIDYLFAGLMGAFAVRLLSAQAD